MGKGGSELPQIFGPNAETLQPTSDCASRPAQRGRDLAIRLTGDFGQERFANHLDCITTPDQPRCRHQDMSGSAGTAASATRTHAAKSSTGVTELTHARVAPRTKYAIRAGRAPEHARPKPPLDFVRLIRDRQHVMLQIASVSCLPMLPAGGLRWEGGLVLQILGDGARPLQPHRPMPRSRWMARKGSATFKMFGV